ncbi:MAG: hypothetical protein FWG40_12820, partial [Peptococcaceae bacterium]|nr:hypothetical protein [Peptococcaceae bacterium]
MNDRIKRYEPLWGTWKVESLIGEGSFGKVYKAYRQEFGKTYYSAVKLISVPYDASEIQRLEGQGLDEESIRRFFLALISDITREIDLMSEFKGNSHIVSFEDYQIIERADTIGWDVLIRMELLTSLSQQIKDRPLPQGEVLKLGVHICRALELCEKKSIIHSPSFGMRGAEPLIRLDFLKSIGHYNLHWLTPIQHISVSEDL